MLKPRHYPIVTLLGAVLITVLPAGVFVLIGRSPFLDEKQATKAALPAAELLAPDDPHFAEPPTPQPVRTVAAPPKDAFDLSVFDVPEVVSQPAEPISEVVETSPPLMRELSSDGHSPSGISIWGTEEMDLTEQVASSDMAAIKPGHPGDVPVPGTPQTERDLGPPVPTQMPTTMAEATGHRLSPLSATTPTSMVSAEKEPSDSKRRRRSRLENPPPDPMSPEMMQGSMPPVRENPFVDMIMRTPVESRRVRRVEDVFATTNETGWPIAMVKSDLPDSAWWVQQMTSIRGNVFTARVNFGNEDSVPGSKFYLAFVFLDTQDEVRRFQIAKQFKEIPAGVRRSREYHFTRR